MHHIVADINDIRAVVICVWVHNLEENLWMRNPDCLCVQNVLSEGEVQCDHVHQQKENFLRVQRIDCSKRKVTN